MIYTYETLKPSDDVIKKMDKKRLKSLRVSMYKKINGENPICECCGEPYSEIKFDEDEIKEMKANIKVLQKRVDFINKCMEKLG